MSQHAFETQHRGRDVTVIVGFDRPLQYVFMMIEKNDPIDEYDAMLYCNLSDEKSIGADAGYFREKLKEFEIGIPESMFDEVRNDQLNNVGNRHCLHQENGKFVEL